MSVIKHRVFDGICPRTPPKLLKENAAQTAENCRLKRGRLQPFYAPKLVQDTPTSGPDVMYLWRHGTTSDWLAWTGDVDIAAGPVAEDEYYRVFGTGINAKLWMIYWNGAMYEQTVDMPTPTAPTAAASPVPADPTKWVYYVTTLVDGRGMEGPPSPVSAKVGYVDGGTVNLSNFGDAHSLPTRRIYRSAAEESENAFFFLVELPAATATYADTLTDAQLAEKLTIVENPPEGLEGLIAHPNGFLCAFKGRTLYFSEPYVPNSWPSEYELPVEYDIVGLAVSCGNLLVLTNGYPYSVAGSHPEQLSMVRLTSNQACVAKRGIAQMGDTVFYPSPDGLVAAYCGGTFRLVTEPYYTREQWQALTPANIKGCIHEGAYFAFGITTPLAIDIGAEGLAIATLTDAPTIAHRDLQEDKLYIAVADKIYEWDGDTATPRTLKWRGREWTSEERVNWSCGRIVCSVYPLTMRLYADNVLVLTRVVPDDNAFRLSPLCPARRWSIEVETTGDVDEVKLATSMMALR